MLSLLTPKIFISKEKNVTNPYTLETIGESLESALGKPLAQKLSPIMETINKADIPEAVLIKAKGDTDGIHGFVYEGKAYIVADNIPKEWSEAQVRGLVMHEIGVHLRKMGDTAGFDRIVEQLKVLAKDDEKVKEAYARVPDTTEAHLIDEEALAYLIQNHPDVSIARRVIAWVKQQLMRMGMSPAALKLTPDDLSAMAWGVVKRNDGAIVSKDTMFHAVKHDAPLSDKMADLRTESQKVFAQIKNPTQAQKDMLKLIMGTTKLVGVRRSDAERIVNVLIEQGYHGFNNKGDEVGEGLIHIVFRHYGEGAIGELSAREIMNVGKTIESGTEITRNELKQLEEKAGKYKFIRGYSRIVDQKSGDKLRVIVGVDKNGMEHTISYHSNRNRFSEDNYPEPTAQIHDITHAESSATSGKTVSEGKSIAQASDESQEIGFSRAQTPEQSAGGFYSAAAKAIEKMPNRMDTAAFVKYLKNNMVKDDEITYSGIAKAIEGKRRSQRRRC